MIQRTPENSSNNLHYVTLLKHLLRGGVLVSGKRV